MSTQALRRWLAIHSWSSLISTLILLVLFLSGLPLIFKSELENWLGYGQGGTEIETNADKESTVVSLETLKHAAGAAYPDKSVHYYVWEDDLPNRVILNLGDSPTSHFSDNFNIVLDENTGDLAQTTPSPLEFFVNLHATLTLGPLGYTLLGVFALLLLIALISGVYVYAPHMRRRDFGDVRKTSSRARWLDLHNLLGMVTLGWVLVVGGTGMINSWGEYVLMAWRSGQIATTIADYHGQTPPAPAEQVSLDRVWQAAQTSVTDKQRYYIAAPGSFMSTPYHFTVFFKGNTPRTQFLLQPVLVDARTGGVTAAPLPPLYIRALFLCQPLHFGNYGGLPLKILWAVFDVLTIFVLVSGIYLWIVRRRMATSKLRGLKDAPAL